jgi:HEPN domain-containing protein
MNKAELQQLTEDRRLDAEALLTAQRWSGAYYLAGYAVECALKACIIGYVQNNPEVIFQKRRFSEGCWTHRIDQLVDAANLKADLDLDTGLNSALGQNWQIVKDWDEEARYKQWTDIEARTLCEAVTNSADGVLSWIKTHW